MARAAVWLAEQQAGGLIHLAGPEVMDRVRFAREIALAFGHDPGLIVGKSTSELGQEAPWPLREGLLTGRLEAFYPGKMRPLAAALEDFRPKLLDPELREWLHPVAGFPPARSMVRLDTGSRSGGRSLGCD